MDRSRYVEVEQHAEKSLLDQSFSSPLDIEQVDEVRGLSSGTQRQVVVGAAPLKFSILYSTALVTPRGKHTSRHTVRGKKLVLPQKQPDFAVTNAKKQI